MINVAVVGPGYWGPGLLAKPLRPESQDFVRCCSTGRRPLSDALYDLMMVEALQRATAPIERGV